MVRSRSTKLFELSFVPNQFPFLEQFFTRLIAGTIAHLAIKQEIHLSLELVSNQRMAALNRRYRGKSGTTDVISFALEEGTAALPDNWPVRELGDIFLAPRYIAKMAPQNNQSTEQAMGFIFVHGLLHLLGHDHPDDTAAAKMDTLTQQILDQTHPGER